MNSLDKTHLNDHNSFSFCLLVCWSLVIFCFVFIPSYLLFLKALKQSHPITLIIIVSPSFHLLILWSLIIFFFLFHLLSVFTWWSVKWKLKEVHLWCKSWTRESEATNPVGLFFWFDQSIFLWDLCRTRIQSLDQIFPFYLFMYLFICSGVLGGRDFSRQKLFRSLFKINKAWIYW